MELALSVKHKVCGGAALAPGAAFDGWRPQKGIAELQNEVRSYVDGRVRQFIEYTYALIDA